MIILIMIYEFFKTGLFAVGGGLATIPFLREMAAEYGWFTENELIDIIAISESTPGPIGINMATYAGFKAVGIFGGLITTLSLVAPSVIIICIVSVFLRKFKDSKTVKGVFYGIRPASVGLIGAAIMSVLWLSVVNTAALEAGADIISCIKPVGVLVYIVSFVLNMIFKKVHPLVFVAGGAVVGMLFGQYF